MAVEKVTKLDEEKSGAAMKMLLYKKKDEDLKYVRKSYYQKRNRK